MKHFFGFKNIINYFFLIAETGNGVDLCKKSPIPSYPYSLDPQVHT